MMVEEEGNGGTTLALEPRQHDLLETTVGEDNTPAAVVSTHMNFNGSREFFFEPPPPPSDGDTGHQQGSVLQRLPSTCSPKVLWAFHW
jgi:hypothetical protein